MTEPSMRLRGEAIPYNGDLARLSVAPDSRLRCAFRQAMLLHGVDLPGLSGMTTAAHTEADIEETVRAVAAALELLQAEGLV